MRRLSFQSGLPDAVDGFGTVPLEAYLWGDWHGDEVGDRATERPAGRRRARAAAPAPAHRRRGLHLPARPGNRDRQGHADQPEPVREPVVARALARGLPHARRVPRGRGGAHPRRDRRAGPARLHLHPARRAPLSAPDRPGHARVLRAPGVDGRALARPRHRARQLGDGGAPRGHVRLPPVPRQPGQPVAGRGRLRADRARRCSGGWRPQRLLLEYDDERSGSFQPLREVPDDKVVVLGLVTTKSPRRETVAELTGRVREAARHIDLERLAISPQCGFATSVLGNALQPGRPASPSSRRSPRPPRFCGAEHTARARGWRSPARIRHNPAGGRPSRHRAHRTGDLPQPARPAEHGRRADSRSVRASLCRTADRAGLRPAHVRRAHGPVRPGGRRHLRLERRDRASGVDPRRRRRPARPRPRGVHALPRQARLPPHPGRGRSRGRRRRSRRSSWTIPTPPRRCRSRSS